MRNVTMLVGGMLMAMTLSVQAAEMQHDGHGQMMEMNAEQAVIQGTGVVQSVDKAAKKSLSPMRQFPPLAGRQ